MKELHVLISEDELTQKIKNIDKLYLKYITIVTFLNNKKLLLDKTLY